MGTGRLSLPYALWKIVIIELTRLRIRYWLLTVISVQFFLFCASDCRCSCECGFLVVSKHETRSLLTNATLLTPTGGSDSGGQNQEKLSHEYFSSDNETNTRKLLWLCLSKHTIQKDYRPQNCYCDLHTRPNQETFALSDIETIHTFRRQHIRPTPLCPCKLRVNTVSLLLKYSDIFYTP